MFTLTVFCLTHASAERKPQLWWRQKCFLFAVTAIDFYQHGEGLDETAVCQWRMLMCLEFPNSIGVLAHGKRRVKGAPRLVATRDGALVELRWLLSGNRQLFRRWSKDKLSAESLKINPFVRLESSVFFPNSKDSKVAYIFQWYLTFWDETLQLRCCSPKY